MIPATNPPQHFTCSKCDLFACPICMKYPKTTRCKQGPDVMRQIKASNQTGSREFETVCKELGL